MKLGHLDTDSGQFPFEQDKYDAQVSIELSDNPVTILRNFELDTDLYVMGEIPDNGEFLSAENTESSVKKIETDKYLEESATCLVLNKKTYGIYSITASSYQFKDHRPSLNLVTIKYLGKYIDPKEASCWEQTFGNEDLEQLKRVVIDLYYNTGMKPRVTDLTVEEWSNIDFSESHNHLSLLQQTESAERNWHARIKIVDGENGPNIIKNFDTSASNLELDRIIAMHLDYRRCMSEIYSVPKLVRIQKLSPHEFETIEPFVIGDGGQDIIANGSISEICEFLSGVILPIAKTIESPRNLPGGIESPFPIKYPVDWKPENFIRTKDGEVFIIDLFPSMLRSEDGSVITLYPKTDNPVKFAINYGEFHVLLARMLSRSVRIRPELAVEMTKYIKILVSEIDKSGKLLQLLRKFATTQDNIRIYGSKPGGVEMFKELVREDL